jgi:hypothetical protein
MDRVRRLKEYTGQKYSSGKHLSTLRKLCLYCESLLPAERIYKLVQADHLIHFCIRELEEERASLYLADSISTIKTAVNMSIYDVKWAVTEDQEYVLRTFIIPTLRKHQPHTVKQAKPVSKDDMLQMHTYLRQYLLADNVWAWQMWCILILAFDAIIRMTEGLDGNLQRCHVAAFRDEFGTTMGMALDILLRKQAKTVIIPGQDQTFISSRDDFLDPLFPLQKLASLRGFTFDKKDTSPLFVRLSRETGEPVDTTYSRAAWVYDWRTYVLKPAGFSDPSLFTGHGFRAGGAINMYVEGVEVQIIKRKGMWSSNAIELYLRAAGVQMAARATASRIAKQKA